MLRFPLLTLIPSLLLLSSTQATPTCVKINQTATATWTNAEQQTCTWTGTVGSNFGFNATNNGDYSCNGRCGAGCTGTALGNFYTLNCFTHDICSYFEDASGGASDPNCGAAFEAAEPDFLVGGLFGCEQMNPKLDPEAPSVMPVCGSAVA